MRALALAALGALLVSGCVAPGAAPQKDALTPPLPALPGWGKVVAVGDSGNEPVIRVAPDGTIYVAALQYVYVSTDNGTTFHASDYLGFTPEYASDSALAVSPDGRAYVAFDWPYAGSTGVCSSADKGNSWTCDNLVVKGATDRMWILAPSANDVYLVTGQQLDRPTFVVSHDKGATWSSPSSVVPVPGAPLPYDPQLEAQGLDLTWDPVHKVVVEGAFDHGFGYRTFGSDGSYKGFTPLKLHSAGGKIDIDAAGTWWTTACANATGSCAPAVARSLDGGKTWNLTPLPFAGKTILLADLAAGAANQVAMAWYETNATVASDAGAEWRYVAAFTKDGETWNETVLAPLVHKGAMCSSASCLGEDRFAGDFLGLAWGPDGSVHSTWMHQTGSKGVPTTQLSTGKWDRVEYARTIP